ncbi:hypothetical protein M404DRAFT_1005450 [Pisolithus tinctorius Marx 270]|uniref:Uncharacterized protein n=1 Tax=Pisolithus tinctorius Marx 270 TaxID=870435 RepID=A0A0C3NST5_PISTI|nr:hypothetical protein M404DRAFT_1005450 [Pisolithus tinctorius Marx 270]
MSGTESNQRGSIAGCDSSRSLKGPQLTHILPRGESPGIIRSEARLPGTYRASSKSGQLSIRRLHNLTGHATPLVPLSVMGVIAHSDHSDLPKDIQHALSVPQPNLLITCRSDLRHCLRG